MRFIVSVVALVLSAPAFGGDPPILPRNPTLSDSTVVFELGGDLWSVPRQGGDARRLTASQAAETGPRFSPDGTWIAFTASYDGDPDVFVMDARGGTPRRLTWGAGLDEAVGWSADGTRVLFRSQRKSPNDYLRLFTVGFDEGLPVPVELPAAAEGSFSPDGKRLAYVPHPRWQQAWKRYRGGQTTPIWVANLADGSIEKIPRGNSNDSAPMWVGNRIFFLSDREGPVTLFAFDLASRAVTRALPATGLDVKSASSGPGGIVYERFGEIRIYDPATGADRPVPIAVSADLLEVRPRWVKLGDKIVAAAISPGGARAAFEAHGEIFTVPAEKGDARNLSRSAATAERDPAWSPDGQKVAYFSDASGEYALTIAPQDGLGPARVIPLGEPPSFFYKPVWSPDGKRIAYHDKRLNLWMVSADGGKPVRIDQDWYETPERSLDPAWSPDSRWIAYTKQLPSFLHAVFAYDVEAGRVVQLTDGMSDARYPVFDAGGKYLFFAASTDVGLAASWLDLSSINRPVTRSVYVAVLAKGVASPLAPESDEEKPPEAKDEGKKDGAKKEDASKEEPKKDDDKKADKKKDAKAEAPRTTIDLEGFSQRILALPLPAKNWVGLAAGKEGILFVAEGPAVYPLGEEPPPLTIQRFDLAKRKADKFLEGVASFAVAGKGEKVLYRQGKGWFIAGAAEPPKPGDGALKLDGMDLLVDPRAEWRQMFHEAWRIQRDFLYDPAHHGLDLAKAENRYAPFVEGLASRNDLNYLFEEMLGELTLGHVFVGGGDQPEPPGIPGGMLGADYALENGRYRIARVYDGENWNPKLRAPLTAPGVDVKAGEYLLAVDGKDLVPPRSIDEALANKAEKQVVLKVGADPSGKDSRQVTVVPVASEAGLRHLAWIEDNRRTVDRLSGGRIAYVHLPDTAAGGYVSFNRYFFAQVGKDAAVLDERFNHGGALADYVIDHLNRPVMSLLATREGRDQRSPGAAIFGPKVMIVNEMAGSGGDAMPWYFRKAGIGKLVGKRTWGGLVGIYDYPPLLDGGVVTAPRVALYGLDGEWEVENVGIAPDVEVDLDPKAWREGRDSQLEAAVKVAMEELERNPPPTYRRPAYPDYHRNGELGRR